MCAGAGMRAGRGTGAAAGAGGLGGGGGSWLAGSRSAARRCRIRANKPGRAFGAPAGGGAAGGADGATFSPDHVRNCPQRAQKSATRSLPKPQPGHTTVPGRTVSVSDRSEASSPWSRSIVGTSLTSRAAPSASRSAWAETHSPSVSRASARPLTAARTRVASSTVMPPSTGPSLTRRRRARAGLGRPHAGDTGPHEVVHEHPTAAVDGGRAEPLERGLVPRARVALVEVEVVAGVAVGLRPHDAVAGHLGQDRCGGDGQAPGVALDEPGAPAAADEVPLAVEQDPVGLQPQPFDRPGRGQPLGRGHAEVVALLLAGVADGPRGAPRPDPVEERLALGLGEHLGVAHLVDPPVAGQHGGAHRQRSGPRPPPHFVHADDHLVPATPKTALDLERRGLRPDRLAQHRSADGRHRRRQYRTSQSRRTDASPASTVPTTVNPASTSAGAAAGSTAANSPPDVCGSYASASRAAGTVRATATRDSRCWRLRASPPVRTPASAVDSAPS